MCGIDGSLRRDFPEMSGLSARNLKNMRAFAGVHSDLRNGAVRL